jgi:hypothetical protein
LASINSFHRLGIKEQLLDLEAHIPDVLRRNGNWDMDASYPQLAQGNRLPRRGRQYLSTHRASPCLDVPVFLVDYELALGKRNIRWYGGKKSLQPIDPGGAVPDAMDLGAASRIL